jgi:hypothetical protein
VHEVEAGAVARHLEFREAGGELARVEEVVVLVPRQQLAEFPHLRREQAGSPKGELRDHPVAAVAAERFARDRNELAVREPSGVDRQMPGLAVGVGRVAEHCEGPAGIGRPDERAQAVVAHRHQGHPARLEAIEHQAVGDALRATGAVELGGAGNEHGDLASAHLVEHHGRHARPDAALGPHRLEGRGLGLHPVVLRIHVGVVEVRELRPGRARRIEGVLQHGGEVRLPQPGVGGKARGEVDDAAAGDGRPRLRGIEQVGGDQRVGRVDASRSAAHEPHFAAVSAIQLAGEFGADLPVGPQDRLHVIRSIRRAVMFTVLT